MIQTRICRTCGRSFQGGPRAYYCPECRVERQRASWRDYKRRKKTGDIRPLGSIDKCERCGKDYTVEGPNQRFCPECQPIHAAEYDRVTALAFYHANKDRINPARYERRRIDPLRACVVCGRPFEHKSTKRITCSEECAKEHNRRMFKKYWPRIREVRRGRAKRIRELRETFGICPRCGKERIEPLPLRGWTPKYCRRCQEYQHEYYLRTKGEDANGRLER